MHLFLIALRSLARHRRRTLLLGGAITLVTFVLVMLLALVQSAQTGMFNMFTTLYCGHVNIEGFYKPTAGRSEFMVTDYPKVLDVVHQAVPEATAVISRGRGWARAVSAKTWLQLSPVGVDIDQDPRLKEVVHPLQGNLEELAKPGTMMLFESGAKRLEVGIGDRVSLSTKTVAGSYNSLDFTVAVIAPDLGPMSDSLAFIPNAGLRALYGVNQNTTGALLIYLPDPSTSPEVAARLRIALDQAGYRLMDPDPRIYFMKSDKVNSEDWKGQKLDVTTYEASMSILKWILDVLRGMSVALVTVLLVVIVVGVMNTLWISIWERTREIGAMRAIGMSRPSVLVMMTSEAMLLSGIATGLGSALGFAVCAFLNHRQLVLPAKLATALMQDRLALHPGPGTVLLTIAGITAFTTLMSIFPSLRAARLSPTIAMQHTA